MCINGHPLTERRPTAAGPKAIQLAKMFWWQTNKRQRLNKLEIEDRNETFAC